MKNTFTALIVDDEESGRAQLQYHLSKNSEFKILAVAGSVDEALTEIDKSTPDVIFLDIDMPKKNGFDLVKEIGGTSPMPEIVFVTAYDKYAIQAIKATAFDYILKPIDRHEFEEMLVKLKSRIQKKETVNDVSKIVAQLKKPEKLRFNQKGRTIFIDPEEIVYCKAEGNYTDLILSNNHYETISQNIKHLKSSLLPLGFISISRSFMYNPMYLCKIDKKNNSIHFQKGEDILVLEVSQRLARKV